MHPFLCFMIRVKCTSWCNEPNLISILRWYLCSCCPWFWLSFVLSRRSLLRLTSWAIQTCKPRCQLSWTEQTCWSETAQTWLMGVLPTAPSPNHTHCPGCQAWSPDFLCGNKCFLWQSEPVNFVPMTAEAEGFSGSGSSVQAMSLLLDSTDLPEVLVATLRMTLSWPFYHVPDFRNHLKLWLSPGFHRYYEIIFFD